MESAPRNIEVRPLSSSTMVITWEPPETPNGQVTVCNNSLLTAQKIHNERMLLRLINKNFHYSFAGIQSVLHHKSEPTGSILAIANGGHKRADHNIRFDKFCDIYNQSAGFYVNGCRAYV